MRIRNYKPEDYEQVAALYRQTELYGGQFDENRDSETRLRKRAEADPEAILVADDDGKIKGTVSLIEDGRVAWLFRFAVEPGGREKTLFEALEDGASRALRAKGHQQVLVYSPVGDKKLDDRYEKLGFNNGGDYTCYWKDI